MTPERIQMLALQQSIEDLTAKRDELLESAGRYQQAQAAALDQMTETRERLMAMRILARSRNFDLNENPFVADYEQAAQRHEHFYRFSVIDLEASRIVGKLVDQLS